MRCWPLLLIAAVAAPAVAREVPAYQPKGSALGSGYKEKLQKDGSWRVEVQGRYAEPLDVAMYRAAELARAEGHAYAELSDAMGRSAYGQKSAEIRVRGSDAGAPSPACAARPKHCYVADVAELLRLLSGGDGSQPGVAAVDHIDEYGREVRVSGFGMAAAGIPARIVAALRFIPAPRVLPTIVASPTGTAPPVAGPARRRAPARGWTISD